MIEDRDTKVVYSEEIESELDEALESALQIRASRRERLGLPQSESSVGENLRSDLRAALSAGLVVAVQPAKDGINERELEREIIKKALISLDAKALRKIALRRGVPVGGSKEEVASRVAIAFKWSREQIAAVVHAYDLETSTENGPLTRLFTTRDSLDLEGVVSRLSYVDGRYVRVGLAKWFMFSSIDAKSDENAVSLEGTLHSYSATVGSKDIQRVETPTSHAIVIRKSGNILVSDASSTQAKACIEAVCDVTGVEVRDYIPNADLNAEAPPNQLHAATEFMLDLIYGRLNGSVFTDPNVLHARFKTQKLRQGAVVDDSKKARLKAVRLDGDYTLDLSQSCQYMALDRRPLLDVTISAHPAGADEDLTCPVRITLDSGHVTIATGPGSAGLDVANDLHALVVQNVEDSLGLGVSDEALALRMAARIRQRALEARDDEDQDPFLAEITAK